MTTPALVSPISPLLVIDNEVLTLIPPQSYEEREQLEINLLSEGCRDPLVVWKGHNILLDGHNRFEICQKHNLPFNLVEIELPNREAVYNWLINNQLGRRNLTPESISYLRGKRYNLEKAKVTNLSGKNQHSEVGDQNDHQPQIQIESSAKTAARLGKEYKVGAGTIRRDARFASAVDTLADTVGDGIRTSILSRNARLTKTKTLELAQIAKKQPEILQAQFTQGELVSNNKKSSHTPFPFQVGEVVRVIARDEPKLRGYGGCWAIITKVNQFSGNIMTWNQEIDLVHPQYLESLNYRKSEALNRQKLADKIQKILEKNPESIVRQILSIIGREKQPVLTPMQEKLLDFFAEEYDISVSSFEEEDAPYYN
jgi:hypothetical protein